MPPARWRLTIRDSGEVVVPRLRVADRFLSRLIGLQFKRLLVPDEGLLLAPCSSVHTCFVRCALDIVMLDRRGAVVDVRRGVVPWRLVLAPRETFAILELAAGSAAVRPGERLRLQAASAHEQVPQRLRFLCDD